MPKFSPAWPLDSFRGLPRKSLWLWPLCSMSGIFQHLPQISPGCGEKCTMDHASYYHIIRTWNIWGSETCLDFSVIWGKTRKICGKNNSGKLLVTPEQTLHPCWLTRQISGLLLWHEVNFSEHKAKLGTTHGPGLRQTHQNWKIWATQIVTLLTYSSKKIHARIDEQKCEHDQQTWFSQNCRQPFFSVEKSLGYLGLGVPTGNCIVNKNFLMTAMSDRFLCKFGFGLDALFWPIVSWSSLQNCYLIYPWLSSKHGNGQSPIISYKWF